MRTSGVGARVSRCGSSTGWWVSCVARGGAHTGTGRRWGLPLADRVLRQVGPLFDGRLEMNVFTGFSLATHRYLTKHGQCGFTRSGLVVTHTAARIQPLVLR